MERLVRILAALLMLALVAGAAVMFVRAQFLKSAPSPIIAPTITSVIFSPDAYRPHRRHATLTFGLVKPDTATVLIFDTNDHTIATVPVVKKGKKLCAEWGGKLTNGNLAPDGPYHFAISLQQQKRLIRIPDPIVLDATPPVVTSTAKPSQRISPGLDGAAGTYTFTLSANEPTRFRLDVRQIDPSGAARLIRRETALQWTQRKELHWSADIGNLPLDTVGAFVQPGSYIVGWHAEDRGGNLVNAPAVVEPNSLAPAQVVDVETVALTPSLQPVTLLADVTLVRHQPGVDFPGDIVARAKGAPGAATLPPPTPGFYAIQISGGGWQAWAPEARAGRARVLVMEPLYSWQASNPSDADLSGFPDVPPAPLTLDRPFAAGIDTELAALGRTVAATQRSGVRTVGAITDQTIESRGLPRSARILVIANAPVWTAGLMVRLRRFVARGGQVVILDSTSLTRLATISQNALTLVGEEAANTTALQPLAALSEIRRGRAQLHS
ncbi:MAG: hypothetical protein CK540_06120 [Thermoleophilia bacterium]|nr:MAG: hypothetical protein CK540_06120 [Thermoleophilia bacterium]